eukprot:scaffold38_cov415-Prasinococcus_capsulatus_cf.AAC.12
MPVHPKRIVAIQYHSLRGGAPGHVRLNADATYHTRGNQVDIHVALCSAANATQALLRNHPSPCQFLKSLCTWMLWAKKVCGRKGHECTDGSHSVLSCPTVTCQARILRVASKSSKCPA